MILFFKGNIKIFESDIYANRNLNDLSVLKHANKGLITGLLRFITKSCFSKPLYTQWQWFS